MHVPSWGLSLAQCRMSNENSLCCVCDVFFSCSHIASLHLSHSSFSLPLSSSRFCSRFLPSSSSFCHMCNVGASLPLAALLVAPVTIPLEPPSKATHYPATACPRTRPGVAVSSRAASARASLAIVGPRVVKRGGFRRRRRVDVARGSRKLVDLRAIGSARRLSREWPRWGSEGSTAPGGRRSMIDDRRVLRDLGVLQKVTVIDECETWEFADRDVSSMVEQGPLILRKSHFDPIAWVSRASNSEVSISRCRRSPIWTTDHRRELLADLPPRLWGIQWRGWWIQWQVRRLVAPCDFYHRRAGDEHRWNQGGKRTIRFDRSRVDRHHFVRRVPE